MAQVGGSPLQTPRLKWRRPLSMRRWTPALLLALGCLLSFGVSWFVHATEVARARAAFEADAQDTRRQIQNALDTYVEVIRAATALLAGNNQINPAEFRAFVAGLQLADRYPALEGIGFSPRVSRGNLSSFVRALRLDGVTRFQVWPAGARQEYYPIIFLEPRADQRVVGFDISTDPVGRAAMERARDTGEPTASGPRQDAPLLDQTRPPDLVMYAPVYRVQAPLQTVEQRRRALIGFVVGPLRLHTLLPPIATAKPSVAFEIYDGHPAAPIYQSTRGMWPSRFGLTQLVQIAGRDWSVAMTSAEEATSVMSPAIWETLRFGLGLTLLIFLITMGQVLAWETTARHQAKLRESERLLRESQSALQQTLAREREARVQLEAADRAKDAFLGTLSHELRTPLNTMLGWLTMLRTESMRADQRHHALEVIERNARIQTQLIEDLLDVSRIVMGKVRLTPRPLAIGPIVSAVIESLRPTAVAKGVTLTSPVIVEPATMWGDASRVEQIIWNLVSNAIKFTPSGGHVSLEVTKDDRHVQILVRDTGVGIPPEFLPHVFERFQQADSSTTRVHGGVGLGLSIVRDLVDLHGGSVEARSDGLNRGASFVVRFPTVTAFAGTSAATADASRSVSLDGVRVLIVDDDAETRELLSAALAQTGARVTTAESAGQALERLRTEGADVVVSDIGMPQEDGLSLMRRIRSLSDGPRQIPAVALTAYARQENRADALAAGYQLYFAKPVELGELVAGLATLTAPSA